ncbi:hypothetical protein N7520_000461 [Penicillium odoratum]|uniref:uncharacterized protein n=1 Tax=Penicillium odoratum TaxID=1167516 RepID=UPI002549643F|nr:uncharacterized protein N7520_000461 [Penicillium odoratum]KAJ5777215.1 hypothetical protein N7520_000461 [Penicillium odoratum]
MSLAKGFSNVVRVDYPLVGREYQQRYTYRLKMGVVAKRAWVVGCRKVEGFGIALNASDSLAWDALPRDFVRLP